MIKEKHGTEHSTYVVIVLHYIPRVMNPRPRAWIHVAPSMYQYVTYNYGRS
jgi:hypothetical protein